MQDVGVQFVRLSQLVEQRNGRDSVQSRAEVNKQATDKVLGVLIEVCTHSVNKTGYCVLCRSVRSVCILCDVSKSWTDNLFYNLGGVMFVNARLWRLLWSAIFRTKTVTLATF